jgi:hypothetical protein
LARVSASSSRLRTGKVYANSQAAGKLIQAEGSGGAGRSSFGAASMDARSRHFPTDMAGPGFAANLHFWSRL